MRWSGSAWGTGPGTISSSSRAVSSNGWRWARAVAGDPAIVLADEPTGNLDSANGAAVMELLDELHQGGATICMVTHDPRYASFAERTVRLLDGRIVEERVAVPA